MEIENKDQKYGRRAGLFVACALSLTYVTTCNSMVLERYSVDSRRRIKTVVWTRIDSFVFDDNVTFDFLMQPQRTATYYGPY